MADRQRPAVIGCGCGCGCGGSYAYSSRAAPPYKAVVWCAGAIRPPYRGEPPYASQVTSAVPRSSQAILTALYRGTALFRPCYGGGVRTPPSMPDPTIKVSPIQPYHRPNMFTINREERSFALIGPQPRFGGKTSRILTSSLSPKTGLRP